LLQHFAKKFAKEERKRIRGFTRKALEVLECYPWPGNIRELEHVARRLIRRVGDGQAIDSSHLEDRFLAPSDPLPAAAKASPEDLDLKENCRCLERQLITRALHLATGNRSQAARWLGIARNTLASKISDLGLDRDS
jgi:DNA-binding NtrC family response regulator